MPLERREFLRLLIAAAAGGAGACHESDAYTPADAALLEERRAAERARAGTGPLGPLRFRGWRGLADLPEFELGPDGELRCVAEDVAGGTDLHAHLGIALLLAPRLDLRRRSSRTRYYLDCDGEPGCDADLDQYMNESFTPAQRRSLVVEQLRQLTLGGGAAETHSAANLVAELDRMGLARAAILPIAFGLPFGDDMAEQAFDQLASSELAPRLVFGASVHPRDPEAAARLRAQADRGARIVKLHPEFQRFYPDAPEAMALYAECERLDLPVIFHAGRSGIEPAWMRRYALLRRYEAAAEAWPRVRFVLGHAGARDSEEAAELAARHANVWLDAQGQGATRLSELLSAVGPEKLVFGTDWPWYHVGATLAKVLLVTQHDAGARRRILRDNAREILGLT
jgi:predicted TIM-barrel fold metal-dependent hydrolase